MKKLLAGKKLKLRPHYKSHKCAEIALRQIADGAIGITCAKLDEAADLADCGIENILIANQITDKAKIAKLAYLAKTCRLTVCVDGEENMLDIENACALADSTVYILIEYEIGMNRCGVKDKETVANLVGVIQKCKHLVFDGIQAYAGHISHTVSLEERRKATEKNSKKIKELLSYLENCGYAVNVLSGGSSGTSVVKAEEGLYNELQAGSYLFMDSTYADLKLPFQNPYFPLPQRLKAFRRSPFRCQSYADCEQRSQ
jgi:D-serine deaminase-like pyridoxal phosphate-dependent protein